MGESGNTHHHQISVGQHLGNVVAHQPERTKPFLHPLQFHPASSCNLLHMSSCAVPQRHRGTLPGQVPGKRPAGITRSQHCNQIGNLLKDPNRPVGSPMSALPRASGTLPLLLHRSLHRAYRWISRLNTLVDHPDGVDHHSRRGSVQAETGRIDGWSSHRLGLPHLSGLRMPLREINRLGSPAPTPDDLVARLGTRQVARSPDRVR